MGATAISPEDIEDFIKRWLGKPGGAERASLSPFIYGFCDVLGLEPPNEPPAKGELGTFQFEGPVPGGSFRTLGGHGAIDLYKEGCFILEAKQSQLRDGEAQPARQEGGAYDRLMSSAYAQARHYAANLPADRPNVPFLLVLDIGRAFEVYFDRAGNGRGFEPFPNAHRHRITLDKLTDLETQKLLRGIWTAPETVDPRRKTAEVTGQVAVLLADVGKALDDRLRFKSSAAASAGARAAQSQEAALFLMRILFCMFAEDVGLLPADSFKDFLDRTLDDDLVFARELEDLWIKMGQANRADRYAFAVKAEVPYFNGGLFRSPYVFPLIPSDRAQLRKAAEAQWRNVEPAIFGTMLEKALEGADRSALGAHYTPRQYVELLVRATFIDDLETEFAMIEQAALEEQPDAVLRRATAFQDKLAELHILDPACGTGNFLYVSMELMLTIEARLVALIRGLGGSAGQRIDPRQFFGLEKNVQAAKITELVLWIGWLRHRMADPERTIPDPVLATLNTINFGTLDSFDSVVRHKIETASETGLRYLGEPDEVSPGPPDWPEADYIVGNPPFIGGKDIRKELGGRGAEALWRANPDVPQSADLVMHWWNKAARALTAPHTRLKRFGFVTTNSIKQAFSRRVIASHLDEISLLMAVPDHPWVKLPREEKVKGVRRKSEKSLKQAKKAAVRIAMTVAEAGPGKPGRLFEVKSETKLDTDVPQIEFHDESGTFGVINSDLSIGADITTTHALLANRGMSSPGVKLHGDGFITKSSDARDKLGLGRRAGLEEFIRPYRNGRDLLQRSRQAWVIDLFGLGEKELMDRFPEVWTHIRETVYAKRWNPKANKGKGAWEGREVNNRESYRRNWWIFGEPRKDLRPALTGLSRYIATVETAKHRTFQFLDTSILADNMIIVIASDDPFHLGVLSSRIHVEWSLRAGGWLGVGNDPRYSKSLVFDPFPFPNVSGTQRDTIADLAERLDRHRKDALAETPKLTITEIYNLRQLVVTGADLSSEERGRIGSARVRIIDDLHRELDATVAAAYGWRADLAPAEIVAGLVALNLERVEEEKCDKIRWLRPDYQKPRFGKKNNKKLDSGSSPE